MAIDWKPEYSVQVEEIDEEHKELVKLINKLYDAINTLKVKEELESIIKELIEFSQYHFDTEEKYFDKFKYEHSVEHKKEHKIFKEKMLDTSKKFKNKEIEVTFELVDFLEDWLIDHLIEEDQKYVKCFKNNGLR